MSNYDHSGIYKLSRLNRLNKLVEMRVITKNDEVELLSAVEDEYNYQADSFVENSIGCFPMPMGIVTGCLINDELINIPLVTEETSVIAGLNKAAKLLRVNGGVSTVQNGDCIIGQLYVGLIVDIFKAKEIITRNTARILTELNSSVFSGLKARGGGAKNIEFRCLKGNLVVLHLHCDSCDAMGANLINMALEVIKPTIEQLLNVKAGACIVSNFNDIKTTTATVEINNLDPEVIDKMLELSRFAQLDHYRAATHNKGIMNAIDGVLIATGNDWRAVEAGMHSYAAKGGAYKGLATWTEKKGVLIGELVAPINLGIVGGVTKAHNLAKMSLKIMLVKKANDLAAIVASVGLMQNFAALHALSSDGIVRGHMRLHIDNLLFQAKVSDDEVIILRPKLESFLVETNKLTLNDVTEMLNELRKKEVKIR